MKQSTATTERVLYGLTFWLKRQDVAAVAGLLRGLSEEERAEIRATMDLPGVLETLYDLDDETLASRMLALGGKTILPVPVAPQRETKVPVLAGKSVMAPAPPDTDVGSFSGYLAVVGNRDGQGDTLLQGSLDETLDDFRAGGRRWLLTDGHSETASDVVAEVTDAGLDGYGLKVFGRWMPTSRAQELRAMVRAGARLGLSIDYLIDQYGPDGAGGRALHQVTVVGGAVTPHPANGLAVMVEGKGAAGSMHPAYAVAGAARVVTVEQEIELGRRRRDPDRDRLRRMAKVVAASWVSPELAASIGTEMAYDMVMGAARAKALRQVRGDPERARAQARRDQANAYSDGLAESMARLARDGCGVCWRCQARAGCIHV